MDNELRKLLEYSLPLFEKMMEDRNYIPLEKKCPPINIIERMNERHYKTPSGKLALIVICNNAAGIKSYTAQICNDEYETIVCIYTNNINISHRKMEKNLNYKIEIWPLLFVYIADHFLQPKIEAIPLSEHKYISIPASKLPKISYYDPLIRYFRIPHKSIIRIHNIDGMISYRIVV